MKINNHCQQQQQHCCSQNQFLTSVAHQNMTSPHIRPALFRKTLVWDWTLLWKYLHTIPHICHFFTQVKFLENKINTEKRVNYDKLHSKLPILRVNYDKLHSKLPTFCVKSVKIYTGQFFFTQAPPVVPVVPVTNMSMRMYCFHKDNQRPKTRIFCRS